MRAATVALVLLAAANAEAGKKARTLAKKAGLKEPTEVAFGADDDTRFELLGGDRSDGKYHVVLVDLKTKKVVELGIADTFGGLFGDFVVFEVLPFLERKDLWDVVVSGKWKEYSEDDVLPGAVERSGEHHFIVRARTSKLACAFVGRQWTGLDATDVEVTKTSDKPLRWDATITDKSGVTTKRFTLGKAGRCTES